LLSQGGGATTRTFTVTDTPVANDLVVSAAIVDGAAAAGALTKAGGAASRMVLSGTNTYTGVTTINANTGVLNVQSNAALGIGLGLATANTVVNAGAALELQGSITLTDEPITNSSVGLLPPGATVLGNTPIGSGGVRSVLGNNTLSSSQTNQ